MDEKSLATLTTISKALADPKTEEAVKAVMIHNPVQEVEESLVTFVRYRLSRLEQSIQYEDTVKDIILSRIGEATFDQLLHLLSAMQKSNAAVTGTMLAPFVAQAGGKTLSETLRDSNRDDSSSAARVYEATDSKQILQAMSALDQLIGSIKNKISQETIENEEKAP